MGVDAVLQDERGRAIAEVGDRKELFAAVLSEENVRDTICLRFIDLYGDTTFNVLQLPVLVRELEGVHARTAGATRDHLRALISLAKRGAADLHVYLKFVGD